MSDPLAKLSELADRVRAGTERGSLDSERAVQLRAVEPLLEALGWDVRGESVVPDASLVGYELDYLLTIGGDPAVVVQTEPPAGDLESEVPASVEPLVGERHVRRAIATDGRTVVLLVSSEGEVHRRTFPFGSLHEQAEALGQFHRSVLETAVDDDRNDRREAARRLATNLDAVADALASEVHSVTGHAADDVVATESRRAVESLVGAIAPDGEDPVGAEGDRGHDDAGENGTDSGDGDGEIDGTHTETAARDTTDATVTSGGNHTNRARGGRGGRGEGSGGRRGEGGGGGEGGEGGRGGRPPAETGGDAGGGNEGSVRDGDAAQADEGGADAADTPPEFVVRFFGGSSSVGAVGTETPGGTTVGSVRYLLENHDLARSITLPWRNADDTVVLDDSIDDPDAVELRNESGTAIAVRPIDEPAVAKRTIQSLAEAAGLRVMFQGDW